MSTTGQSPQRLTSRASRPRDKTASVSTATLDPGSATQLAADEEAAKEADRLHKQAERKFLRQALLKEVQNFSDYTHICGFERIFNAKFFVLRLIWFVVVMAAIGLTIFQLVRD